MKYICFIVTSLLFAMSLNAQGIKYRRLLDPEGLSIMTTNLAVFPWGEKRIEYALQYEVAPIEDMHQGYYLNIYLNTNNKSQYIPEGGKLLIRTTKDNVISLTDCGSPFFVEYDSEYDYTNSERRSYSFYDSALKTTRYSIHGKYPITEDDLKMLMEEGVIKIRIETTGDMVECSYKVNSDKTNKTAEVITKLYNLLQSQIDPYYGL